MSIDNVMVSIPLETGGQDKEPVVEIRARHLHSNLQTVLGFDSVLTCLKTFENSHQHHQHHQLVLLCFPMPETDTGALRPAMALAGGRVALVLWMLWLSTSSRHWWGAGKRDFSFAWLQMSTVVSYALRFQCMLLTVTACYYMLLG